MNFAALPPEINSIRMYSGPGSGPLLAAAAAWDSLAAELHSAAAAYESVVSQLASGWLGPASQAMAAAAAPYVAWLANTAVQVGLTGTQAKAAAAGYEAAFAMTVPPSVVAANRAQLMLLVATNVLGQNTAAIAANEALYAEMWAQDAAAMDGYAIVSMQAGELPPFAPPSQTADPAGLSAQAGAASQNLGSSAGSGVQSALSQAMPAASQAAAQAPAAPLPPFDLLGFLLPSLADLDGLNATSAIALGLAAGAWTAADESTRQILNEQDRLEVVQYDILHAIDLFSPLTPSRPGGWVPAPLPTLPPHYGVFSDAVSVGKLSVPMSWAANAPEIRSLSYTAPIVGPGAASAAAASVAASGTVGSAGTAFSQMALAGMGGSAMAGAVKPGRPGTVETSTPQNVATPAEEPLEKPVTGIAAEIREFAELRDRGLITNDEYNEQKQRLLGR